MKSLLSLTIFSTTLVLAQPSLLLTPQEVKTLRDKKPAELLARVREEAKRWMTRGPWSVTAARPDVKGIGTNDFYSTGPYWWPNPKDPSGPYIRRDGERNPNRFTANDDDMGDMSSAVLSLGMAAALLDDRAAADRAAELIRVWFVDPKTRMNPNLEWGQAIPGVADGGRGTGIIDSRPLINCTQGMALLEMSGYWKGDAAREWFREYVSWLTTSKKGLDEKRSKNNHATWWAAQVAAYTVFVGDKQQQEMVWRLQREVLVPNQFKDDGSAPLEEARTRSLSYSVMNLGGFTVLCRIAQNQGVDLWGGKLGKAVAYLAPYVENPSSWGKQQIAKFDPNGAYFLGLAGVGMNKPEWVAQYRKTVQPKGAWLVLIEAVLAAK